MKIVNIKNFDEFFKVVNSCSGRVELVTDEGDRLNLKSRLSQLVSFTTILDDKETLEHSEVVAYDPSDMKKLESFIMNE